MHSKRKGIGLLELMLSMALISLLLVMATRYYTTARQNQQVNDAISLVEAVIAGSENWVIGKTNYTGITIQTLIQEGYLPPRSDSNPWHGPVTVQPSQHVNEISIVMAQMPATACYSLAQKLNNQMATPLSDPRAACSGNPATFTATF